jgi:thiosulfate dehydrogenase
MSPIKIAFYIVSLVGIVVGCSNRHSNSDDTDQDKDTTQVAHLIDTFPSDAWRAPDTASIPNDESGKLIRYGRELVANSSFYFGPHGTVSQKANVMNCQNCHLNAGTKLYANSYCGVYSIYPKFRPRSGTIENVEKRINDCMERSLNGEKLEPNSKEMQAMKAYINWVGKDVEKGISPTGASVVDVPLLYRPADPSRGEYIFKKTCVECHGDDGLGKLNPDSITYQYPPLWGPKSYNTAAGMYRLSRLSGFVKSNMPYQKSSYVQPKLSDEEAWDVAAFINSQPRPDKKFKKDWPDISKKPMDFPFGPYADTFSEYEHKYGPYQEIVKGEVKH